MTFVVTVGTLNVCSLKVIFTVMPAAGRRVASVRLRLKCDGTRAETRFRLSAKRTNPFKSAGGGGVSSVDYSQPRCAHQR